MSRIDRKSRDRKEGHKSASLPLFKWGDGIVHYTPVERAFIKRNGKKAMRRQHVKAIADGHAEMLQESRDFELDLLALDFEWYDDSPMDESWYHHEVCCCAHCEDPYLYDYYDL